MSAYNNNFIKKKEGDRWYIKNVNNDNVYYTSISGGFILHKCIKIGSWLVKPYDDYVQGLTIKIEDTMYNIISNWIDIPYDEFECPFFDVSNKDKYMEVINDMNKKRSISPNENYNNDYEFFNILKNLKVSNLTYKLLSEFQNNNLNFLSNDENKRYNLILKNIEKIKDYKQKQYKLKSFNIKLNINYFSNKFKNLFKPIYCRKIFDFPEDISNSFNEYNIKFNYICKYIIQSKITNQLYVLYFSIYTAKARFIFEYRGNKIYSLLVAMRPLKINKDKSYELYDNYYVNLGILINKFLEYNSQCYPLHEGLKTRTTCPNQYKFIGDIYDRIFPSDIYIPKTRERHYF